MVYSIVHIQASNSMTRLVSNPIFPYYNNGWSLVSEIWMIFHVSNKISHSISWTIFISSWNFLKTWFMKVHPLKILMISHVGSSIKLGMQFALLFWQVHFTCFQIPLCQKSKCTMFNCQVHYVPNATCHFFLSYFFDLIPLWTLRGALSFKLPFRLIFSHIESKLKYFEFKFHVFFISIFINDVDLKPSYSNESLTIKF
jgi:hypothetical protein